MRALLRRLGLWAVTVFRPAPLLTVLGVVLVVAAAVLTPLATAGVGRALDGLVAGDDAAVDAGLRLIVAGLVVGAVSGLSFTLIWPFVRDLGERYVRHRVLILMAGIPTVAHHEEPVMADRVALVRRDARSLGMGAQYAAMHVSTLVGTATIAGVLAAVQWWMVLLLPAAAFPAWATRRTARARVRAEKNNVHAVRTADRLLEIARDPATGIEIRCSGAAVTLLNIQLAAQAARMDAVAEAGRRTRTLAVVARLSWIALLAVSLAAVFALVRSGGAQVGELVVVVLLLPQIQMVVTGLERLVHYLVETTDRITRLDDLQQYAVTAAGPADVPSAPDRLRDGIELRQVGFHYPQSEQAALQNVSLTLAAGTTVALVGENGAGKSTLVKLLARLYTPTDGELRIDGIPFDDIDHGSWHGSISAVLQDHTAFEFLVSEAVGIGDLAGGTDTAVRAALVRAAADGIVDGLPSGTDTQLGRKFAGGTDLSGGQWQRVAIARGLMRPRPLLMLLDEPSSALDPDAEDAILVGFLDHAREVTRVSGGITVIVSHRMSTVRAADRVIHLAGGRVIEDGTHDELMAAGGAYAEMFELQARSYR